MVDRHIYDADVIIVGAGISGLATALLLHEQGATVRVLEANGRSGGRVHSVFSEEDGHYLADLGPTWVWPKYQPVISNWLDKLGLERFPQHEQGDAILDYGPGTSPDTRYLPGQDGSVRINGGPQAIIDQLVAALPEDTVRLNALVTSITTTPDGVTLGIDDDQQTTLRCQSTVIALPPRIAAQNIQWQPDLQVSLRDALDQTPTWMAPHAKVVALYDEPFWRELGLSGRIASNAGPIGEAHDHCGPDGSPAAIFGFIGLSHTDRTRLGENLEKQIHDQLQRCFGADSPAPRSIHIEDWAESPTITSPRDLSEPMSHPNVRPGVLRASHADGRLFFAGAETAQQSPGLIEGAFDAAERAVKDLMTARVDLLDRIA